MIPGPTSCDSRRRGRSHPGWKAFCDEVDALRVLHFDPTIRHQLVGMTIRILGRAADKSGALQIAHIRWQVARLLKILLNDAFELRHFFIHLQSLQMVDRVFLIAASLVLW